MSNFKAGELAIMGGTALAGVLIALYEQRRLETKARDEQAHDAERGKELQREIAAARAALSAAQAQLRTVRHDHPEAYTSVALTICAQHIEESTRQLDRQEQELNQRWQHFERATATWREVKTAYESGHFRHVSLTEVSAAARAALSEAEQLKSTFERDAAARRVRRSDLAPAARVADLALVDLRAALDQLAASAHAVYAPGRYAEIQEHRDACADLIARGEFAAAEQRAREAVTQIQSLLQGIAADTQRWQRDRTAAAHVIEALRADLTANAELLALYHPLEGKRLAAAVHTLEEALAAETTPTSASEPFQALLNQTTDLQTQIQAAHDQTIEVARLNDQRQILADTLRTVLTEMNFATTDPELSVPDDQQSTMILVARRMNGQHAEFDLSIEGGLQMHFMDGGDKPQNANTVAEVRRLLEDRSITLHVTDWGGAEPPEHSDDGNKRIQNEIERRSLEHL